jgi:hypothetical protein
LPIRDWFNPSLLIQKTSPGTWYCWYWYYWYQVPDEYTPGEVFWIRRLGLNQSRIGYIYKSTSSTQVSRPFLKKFNDNILLFYSPLFVTIKIKKINLNRQHWLKILLPQMPLNDFVVMMRRRSHFVFSCYRTMEMIVQSKNCQLNLSTEHWMLYIAFVLQQLYLLLWRIKVIIIIIIIKPSSILKIHIIFIHVSCYILLCLFIKKSNYSSLKSMVWLLSIALIN